MTNVTEAKRSTGSPSVLPVYLTAAALARTADEGARVALVMLAAQRAGSPALGGALVAALMIPHVAAAPVAGAMADSVRRRRLFHGGGIALYGIALAALAALVGRAGDLVALALAVAAGCVAPLGTGGLTSLLGELRTAPGRVPGPCAHPHAGRDPARFCGQAGPSRLTLPRRLGDQCRRVAMAPDARQGSHSQISRA
ncbi:hypothetical protein [Streptomyces sp. NPDC054804]